MVIKSFVRFWRVSGLSLCFLVSVRLAAANVGEATGFGSRVSGLAGVGVVGNSGGFAAYHNPAELSRSGSGASESPELERLKLSWGLVYLQPNFRPITGVVLQNKFVADGVSRGDVAMDYRETLGQELGISFVLFPEFQQISLGLTTFLPINAIAYMDTGPSYAPEYFLYRSRTQRPQFEFGLGGNLGAGFSLGAGVHLGFALTGSASAFINTKTGTTSSLRFASSLKPKASPYFGILYSPSGIQTDSQGVETSSGSALGPLSLGLVVRLPLVSDNTMSLSSAARVFGDFAAVDFNFNGVSALFYDPLAVEFGFSWRYARWGRILAQVDYQAWSGYQAPVLAVQPPAVNCTNNGTGTSCGTLSIAAGILPSVSYVNIFVPRVAHEVLIGESSSVRLGYSFKPSVLERLPSEGGNYLDPSRHTASMGYGHHLKQYLGLKSPVDLDFHFNFQYLEIQHIVKSVGNEAVPANLNDAKIGSPGYDSGGYLAGGGVSATFYF